MFKVVAAFPISSHRQGLLVQITDIAHHFAKRPVLLRRIQVATCLNSGPLTDKDPVYLKAAVGSLALFGMHTSAWPESTGATAYSRVSDHS